MDPLRNFSLFFGSDDTADLKCLACKEYIPIFNSILLSQMNEIAREHVCKEKE